jgi:sarcosine oxidase
MKRELGIKGESVARLKVAVLGVGGMGSAVCRSLARRGVEVIGLEQYALGHDRGSSHGESRLIRQAYFEHPDYVPLLKSAYQLWAEVEEESGTRVFNRTGLVLFGPRGKSAILRGVREAAGRHAIPIEELEGAKARKRFPLFRLAADDEAIVEPGAGYLEVEKAVRTQALLARRDGAEIRAGAKVLGWEAIGDRVQVQLLEETLEVDRLVITSGAWSRELLSGLGVSLSVHRNLLFWYPAPDWFSKVPCFAFERGRHFFYGFPKANAFGVKVGDHVPGRPIERPEHESIPELALRPSKVKACLYELSPDEHFIVDTHPSHRQVVLGAGFSGHGFKFSPVIGEALADLALNGSTLHPIGFLGLDRFRRPTGASA